ncbi:hypothetical protein RRG08_047272 [Elysia crispata]|uniref:Uncharacterized protein n=1 Tax=Elysia crispata TaxID=231223 RepID=A0AAE0ZC93_9GAST|nr:hypothetical protein RRG08_047272 [Elysia crispata]
MNVRVSARSRITHQLGKLMGANVTSLDHWPEVVSLCLTSAHCLEPVRNISSENTLPPSNPIRLPSAKHHPFT